MPRTLIAEVFLAGYLISLANSLIVEVRTRWDLVLSLSVKAPIDLARVVLVAKLGPFVGKVYEDIPLQHCI